MADQDIIQTTALAVVEQQQKIVGSALVGSAGAGALAGGDSQSQFDILEQIRDLQMKSFRGIQEVVKKLSDMLSFDENVANRTKEDANELAKENQGKLSGSGSDVGDVGDGGDEKEGEEKAKGLAALSGFFAGLPGVAAIGKLLTPITAFFGKSGMLFKLFGRFGPLGAIILGFTILYKYLDEITKALAPALDKIKELVVKLQPAIDVLMAIGDFLIKGIIEGIGQAISFVIGTVETFIDGFTKLFSGDIIGGLSDIFEGIVRAILTVPLMIVNFLTPLFKNIVGLMAEPWDNMVNSIHTFFGNLFTSIGEMFMNVYNNVKDFVTSLPDRFIGFVTNMFAPIIDFFAGIGDRIKTAVNGIIDSLPLPKFVKDKMKFETEATKAADERIDETGVKGKYVDDSITGMQRERMTGGGATMGEGFAEAQGEKYGTAKITQSGTAGYDSAAGILTPKQMTELNSLKTTDEQMAYLKSLDEEEQKRREMILSLRDKKIAFDKQNADYIKKYKVDEPEFMSPDDQMLQDSKFQRQAKIQASSIKPSDNKQTPIIINKGGDTNNASVQTKSETYTGPLETGIDPYFDRASYNSF
jgi:hypothetical protein